MTTHCTTRPATDAQFYRLRRLLNERDVAVHGVTSIDGLIESLKAQGADTKFVSALMDQVEALPVSEQATAAPQATIRTNNYASKCVTCGGWVEAGAGRIQPKVGVKGWDTLHLDGQCPAKAAPLSMGLYTMDDDIWWVREGRRSGHLYVMRLVSDPDSKSKAQWDYIQGGMSRLARGKAVRDDDGTVAARLGHASHHCCFCGLSLTDDGENRSVKVGYGPVCAEKYGLPWG